MRIALCIAWTLLFMAGCVQSARIAYYRPSGEGKMQKDSRRVPQEMKYGFGTASQLVFRTRRTAEKTEIWFWLQLRDAATFRADAIEVSCEHGETLLLQPSSWSEWRIKDGVGYKPERAWNASLSPADYDTKRRPPSHGDVSVGQYWSTAELSSCMGEALTVQIPSVDLSSGSHSFGKVTLHPEEARFTWGVPLQ
jgi:hypothetical protein